MYFGGGTPSLFPPRSFARLLDAFCVSDDVEVTLEANPGTVETAGPVADYASAGINRVSLGVQSFDDGQLRSLGRIHDGGDAERAARAIGAAGFREFNIDLMFGLTGQSVESALADLERAVALEPAHVSWYQLTIEPRTEFARRPPELPDPDTLADIAEAGQALLADRGYARYEVSAYARPGSRSRHNLNYWTFGDYLGIGAGAHGKLTRADGIVRTAKARQPRLYLKDPAPLDTPVDAASLPVEFMDECAAAVGRRPRVGVHATDRAAGRSHRTDRRDPAGTGADAPGPAGTHRASAIATSTASWAVFSDRPVSRSCKLRAEPCTNLERGAL